MRAAIRWMLATMILLGLASCRGGFRDPAEELAYLESLSNPTPAQWQRREALKAGAQASGQSEMDRKRFEAAKAMAEKFLDDAVPAETTGDLDDALSLYQGAVEAATPYPESDFYQKAKAGRDRIQRAIVNR